LLFSFHSLNCLPIFIWFFVISISLLNLSFSLYIILLIAFCLFVFSYNFLRSRKTIKAICMSTFSGVGYSKITVPLWWCHVVISVRFHVPWGHVSVFADWFQSSYFHQSPNLGSEVLSELFCGNVFSTLFIPFYEEIFNTCMPSLSPLKPG
jgi:hypothetical protein